MKKQITTYWSLHKTWILIAILVIFHVVGLVGLLSPIYRDSFLKLSFMNLLLAFIVLLVGRRGNFKPFYWFLVICFFTGMFAEMIGIHTGILFGEYYYGENLGAKLNGVPFIIGINWGILSVGACSVVSRFHNGNIFLSVLMSALLMTLLDVLIEPVAIQSDYWHWKTSYIPLKNYLSWFFISMPLHYLYFKWKLDEQNNVSIALFSILVAFFIILNLN